MSKKILIVGGTGFLGYHFAKLCLKKNYKVFSVSRKKPNNLRKLKKVNYIFFDISKKNYFKKLNFLRKVNYILNFGGEVDHKNINKVYKSHYVGVKNLVKFYLNSDVEKFIQIGSSMEYGICRSPNSENTLCNPISNYGCTKLKATDFLLKMNDKKKFPSIILRPYQVYGPYQDPNRLIPFVIKNCLKGKTFPTSKGNQKRDFIHVQDFVNAVFKIMKKKKLEGNIFNIGYGKPIAVKKIIQNIKSLIGAGEPKFGEISLRKEEKLVTYPNISKIKKNINWYPKITIKKGLRKTINYYKKALEL